MAKTMLISMNTILTAKDNNKQKQTSVLCCRTYE